MERGSSSRRATSATSAQAGSTMQGTSRPASLCTSTTGPLPSISPMPRPAEEGRRRVSDRPQLSRTPVVAIIGMATADYLYVLDDYPKADSVTPALEHQIVVGGLAGRGAIAAARLGGATKLLAACGTGDYAQVLMAELDAEGVDCTWVAYDQPSQHSVVILARGDATRTIIWLPQPMADARMIEQLPDFLEGVDVARLDSTDEALATAALDECERRGVTTVIDTGSGRPWTASLLGRADHVIAPEKYVLRETGHPAERAALELWGGSCRAVFGVTEGPRVHDGQRARVPGAMGCCSGDRCGFLRRRRHLSRRLRLGGGQGPVARRVLRYRRLVRGTEDLPARQRGHPDAGSAGGRTQVEPPGQARVSNPWAGSSAGRAPPPAR